jgi:hypothetical protein
LVSLHEAKRHPRFLEFHMYEELKAFILISNNSQRVGISYFSGDLLHMRTEIHKLQSCCCCCYKVYSIPVQKPKHATPSTELGQLENDTRRSTRMQKG